MTCHLDDRYTVYFFRVARNRHFKEHLCSDSLVSRLTWNKLLTVCGSHSAP